MSDISKEWLDEKFRVIDARFKENKDDHRELIEQTTKTNGSVRKLQLWKAYITGAIAVLSFIIGVTIALIGFFSLR